MSGNKWVESQKKRFAKAVKSLVFATERVRKAQSKFRIEWGGLTASERKAIIKEVLELDVSGQDAQQIIDCINC